MANVDEMRIEYFEQDGKLGIQYRPAFEDSLFLIRPLESGRDTNIDWPRMVGFVPKDVQEKGKDAIRGYAKRKCDADLKKLKEERRRELREADERQKTLNQPISIMHKGTLLKGRIVIGPSGYDVIVKLEDPFKAQTTPYSDPTCFASSMAGHRTFSLNDGSLTQWAIKDAEENLTHLYDYEVRRRKHGKVLKLSEDLNGEE